MNEQEPTNEHEPSPWVREALDLGKQASGLRLPKEVTAQPPTLDHLIAVAEEAQAIAYPADAVEDEDGHEAQPRDGPRIYVASLTDYNNGLLYGRWCDAIKDAEDMQTEIDAMLSASPSARRFGEVAEEWAIHDYEGFGELRIGEYQGLDRIARLAGGIREHGLAFAAWAAFVGEDSDDLLDQFEDRFQGEWESVEAYAEMLLDELGANRIVDEAPEWLQPYVSVDVAGFARDLEISGDVVTAEHPDGGVWIFAGH